MTVRKEFKIRLSLAEKRKLEELSLQAGYKSISAFIRANLFLPRKLGAKEIETRSLVLIGNSLQYMAKQVAARKPVLARDIREVLAMVAAYISDRRHARSD